MKKFSITAYYNRTESLEMNVEIEAESEEDAIKKFKDMHDKSELDYNNLKECGEMSTELDEDGISAEEIIESNSGGFIINDEVLLEDTVSGIIEHTSGSGLTEDQIRDYLDENEMNTITEAMYEAKSFEIQNMVPEILEHFGLEVEDEEQWDD